MKKIIVALFLVLFAAMPLAAEAQVKKKKKKQNEEQNPLVLLLGLFTTANCVVGCGTVTSVAVTTVFIPERERFVTTVVKKTSAGSFVTGGIVCTVLWPFINVALGGKEPTPEEALLNTASCWVPGLGLILFLQQQGVV